MKLSFFNMSDPIVWVKIEGSTKLDAEAIERIVGQWSKKKKRKLYTS